MVNKEILDSIPHREPFLFVTDEILIAEDGNSGDYIYEVTGKEPFFKGHFPRNPIMPGNLIVEALAQAGAVLITRKLKGNPETKNKMGILGGVDGFRFRKLVRPGDTLELHIDIRRIGSAAGKIFGRATVDGKRVTEGEMLFLIVDKNI